MKKTVSKKFLRKLHRKYCSFNRRTHREALLRASNKIEILENLLDDVAYQLEKTQSALDTEMAVADLWKDYVFSGD